MPLSTVFFIRCLFSKSKIFWNCPETSTLNSLQRSWCPLWTLCFCLCVLKQNVCKRWQWVSLICQSCGLPLFEDSLTVPQTFLQKLCRPAFSRPSLFFLIKSFNHILNIIIETKCGVGQISHKIQIVQQASTVVSLFDLYYWIGLGELQCEQWTLWKCFYSII